MEKFKNFKIEEGVLLEYTGNGGDVVIPEGVTSIGDYAFRDCYSLTSVTIGNSVTSIGEGAFSSCPSLTSVIIPKEVISIGGWAFEYCTALTIYCEVESKPEGWDYDWSDTDYGQNRMPVVWDYDNNDIAEDGNIYTVQNGIRYAIKDGFATVAEQSRNIAGSVTIPASVIYNNNYYKVTKIEEYAFYNCTLLTGIIIPESIKIITYAAFEGCSSLTSVVIGDSVTDIDKYAFENCKSLTSIEIPDSVINIDNYAFQGCTALTSVVTSENVKWIGCKTFYGCSSLTSITIPNSVTSIGYSAFEDCNNLVIQTIKGSYAEEYAKENDIPMEYITSKMKDFIVYYTKKVKGKIYKRNCIFINSTEFVINAIANGKHWQIEEITSLQNGKSYALENGIAYTEDSGATWVFDHCQ